MQHYRIVGAVRRMSVAVPVAGFEMYLYVSGPHASVDAYLGIEKVGACVGVEPAGVDDLNASSVDCAHVVLTPQTMLPYILHQFFHRSLKL